MSMQKQRNVRKECHWRQRLREWRQSGLSVREFCRVHGLSEPSFYAWRRELTRRNAIPSATFVPVEVTAGDSVGPSSILEIVVPGQRCIRVRPGFDAATLRQLLAVLEDQPC